MFNTKCSLGTSNVYWQVNRHNENAQIDQSQLSSLYALLQYSILMFISVLSLKLSSYDKEKERELLIGHS